MKKILFILSALVVFTTGCTAKNKNVDNPNTPFVELSKNDMSKVKKAFFSENISRSQEFSKDNYSIENRKNMTVSFQENYDVTNLDDYHYWLTCYYLSDETIVFHVERTNKGYDSLKPAYYSISYSIGNYSFNVYGRNLQNYTYILVYNDGKLYELDYAYSNKIITDNELSNIYKSYIDSKFIKFDPYYNPYTQKTPSISE